MSTARERLARVEALFVAARELVGSERADFLRRECGDDVALRVEVEQLLELDAGKDTALDRPADPWLGQTLDRWRVSRRLGAGGMGIVYVAERSDGAFRQVAALKVLKHGIERAELVERFRQERQILAGLSHPGIARLIDGGATPEGVPWLVMELVPGTRLDLWCDQRQLGLRRRLELFRTMCGAVHYAHQRLVVHRDIKPSNILVTAEGAPVLVDFGISKVIDVTRNDPATRNAERRLTPEYAAPEVIRGTTASTASDVFSLGVLLHELLTGSRPWRVAESDVTALERAIEERAPPAPSEVSVSGEAAAARGHSPVALRRHLRGDLDAIVAKCLSKDPSERYSSAQALADDISRTLAHEPVSARPGALPYVFGRFVRRHRTLAAATLLGLGALAAGAAGVLQGARAARRHADATQRVNTLLSDMLVQLDPASSRGFARSLLNQLDAADRRLDEGLLADDPAAELDLRGMLGRTFLVLGYGGRASEQFSQALQLAQRELGPDHLRVEMFTRLKGASERTFGRAAEAAETLSTAVALARGLVASRGANDREALDELIHSLHEQGLALQALRRVPEAEAALREALELRIRLDGSENESVAGLQNALAGALLVGGDAARAEPLARAAWELRKRIHPELEPRRVWSDETLARVLLALDRVEEALPLAEHGLELRRKLFDPLSPPLAVSFMLRGDVLRRLGRQAEAAADYLEALAIRRSGVRDDATLEHVLLLAGVTLAEAGELERARPLLEEGLATGAPETPPLRELRQRARTALAR